MNWHDYILLQHTGVSFLPRSVCIPCLPFNSFFRFVRPLPCSAVCLSMAHTMQVNLLACLVLEMVKVQFCFSSLYRDHFPGLICIVRFQWRVYSALNTPGLCTYLPTSSQHTPYLFFVLVCGAVFVLLQFSLFKYVSYSNRTEAWERPSQSVLRTPPSPVLMHL